MRIEVTQEDIKRGGHMSDCCPIHHALERLGLNWRVGCRILFKFGNAGTWGEGVDGPALPKVACEWLDDYDNLLPVEPFTFDLEVPV